MVIERAKELAMINGRDPNHFSKDDFLEAKRELVGSGEDRPDDTSSLLYWDESPDATGHSAVKTEPLDEQTVGEQLVEEGVNEAEHDQMVAGVRTQNEER